MSARACGGNIRPMARYLLHLCHQPHECGIVFASFKATRARFATSRRSPPVPPAEGYEFWWTQAGADADAVRLLPSYVAEHTTARYTRQRGRDSHDRQESKKGGTGMTSILIGGLVRWFT